MIHVWDASIRLYHWLQAGLVLFLYFGETHLPWLHVAAGGALTGLLLYRMAWGFVGSTSSRFHHFPISWTQIRTHAGDLLHLEARNWHGHTPLGACMVLTMLLLLGLQSLVGWIILGAWQGHGPAYAFYNQMPATALNTFQLLHQYLGDIIIGAAAVHVCGVVMESLLLKENLLRSMAFPNPFKGDH